MTKPLLMPHITCRDCGHLGSLHPMRKQDTADDRLRHALGCMHAELDPEKGVANICHCKRERVGRRRQWQLTLMDPATRRQMVITDASAAYERSHGSDPDRRDAAGEYQRLRVEGMTPEQANAFMLTGKVSYRQPRRRERRLALMDPATRRWITEAVRAGQPLWLTDPDGNALAVVMEAKDYHDPRRCCCKNCPWNGDHGLTT